MESILNCLEFIWTVIYIAGSFIWAILSGIVIGLWNNPMLILFIVGLTAPVAIVRKVFKIR